MKKIFLLPLVFLHLTNICSGQNFNDGDLQKVKDYINNKITLLMLGELVKSEPQFKTKFSPVRSELSLINPESALGIKELEGLLNKDFKKTFDSLSQSIDKISLEKYNDASGENIANGIYEEAYSVLVNQYAKRVKSLPSLRETKKAAITSPAIAYLNDHIPPQPPIQKKSAVPGDSLTIHTTTQAGFFNTQQFNFWTLLPLLLSLAALLISFLIYKRISSRQTIASNVPLIPVASSKSNVVENYDLEKALSELWKIRGLELEIKELREMIPRTKQPVAAENRTATVTTTPAQNISPQAETFYMVSPANNYFLLSAKSTTRENTVYKFTTKENPQEASFEVHTTGASINDILSMLDNYIKPACEEENIPNFPVRNIITKHPGIAKLEGDKWIIQTKAVIRYE